MLKKLGWILLVLVTIAAYSLIWANRSPPPTMVEGFTEDGRQYFCIYEVK